MFFFRRTLKTIRSILNYCSRERHLRFCSCNKFKQQILISRQHCIAVSGSLVFHIKLRGEKNLHYWLINMLPIFVRCRPIPFISILTCAKCSMFSSSIFVSTVGHASLECRSKKTSIRCSILLHVVPKYSMQHKVMLSHEKYLEMN